MSLLDNLLESSPYSPKNEHSVLIRFFNYHHDELDALHELEEKLARIITEQGVGEYDGHEIALEDTDGCLYMYGPNAELLFKAVKPTLESTDFMKGAIAILTFGPYSEDASQIEIELQVE